MKAILVIDKMPTGCIGCPCYCEDRGKCQNTWVEVENDCVRPLWCPLKPIPKKHENVPKMEYELGWNDCIEEIEK